MSRRLESGLIRIPLLAIRLLGTSGENSGPMKIRGAIATPPNSRRKITKEPQLFRLRDELLLIPVNAQLEYRKRRAEGADKNTTHHPRINRSPRTFPVCARPTLAAVWRLLPAWFSNLRLKRSPRRQPAKFHPMRTALALGCAQTGLHENLVRPPTKAHNEKQPGALILGAAHSFT